MDGQQSIHPSIHMSCSLNILVCLIKEKQKNTAYEESLCVL